MNYDHCVCPIMTGTNWRHQQLKYQIPQQDAQLLELSSKSQQQQSLSTTITNNNTTTITTSNTNTKQEIKFIRSQKKKASQLKAQLYYLTTQHQQQLDVRSATGLLASLNLRCQLSLNNHSSQQQQQQKRQRSKSQHNLSTKESATIDASINNKCTTNAIRCFKVSHCLSSARAPLVFAQPSSVHSW